MMNMTSIKWLTVFIVLLASCSRGPTVADVDGRKISAEDLRQAMTIEKEKYDPILLKIQANADNFKRAVLESLIQEALLLNTAKHIGVKVDDGELNSALQNLSEPALFSDHAVENNIWKEKQRRRLIISKLIKQEVAVKIPIPVQDVAAYYKSHKKDFSLPTQYHARQIVVDSKKNADGIAARLAKGEDFAKLADEFSLSPDRQRGGDLGFFNSATFPPIFTEICEKLKIGEISNVVATDYGYQIFELLEKRSSRQQSMGEVKPEIEVLLREKQLESTFKEWFKRLREKASITINEQVLESTNV